MTRTRCKSGFKPRRRRPIKPCVRSIRVICGALLALALGASVAAADLYPGSYNARAKGVSVKLDIGQSGGGSLAYSMKTACGKSKGKLELSKSGAELKGRRVSRGPEATLRTTVAKVALNGGGSEVVGTIKESLKGGDSELAGCRAKRAFSASVEQADGFVPSRDDGHYSGTGPNGLPISFDIVSVDDNARVEDLAVDVTADCFDESAEDAVDIPMVTHITGMSGRVAKDGTFYIEYAPDEDTEYEFDGELSDGAADVDVIIGGNFDANGNPNSAGPFTCDSWGDIYDARRD